jgi:hypothetical protein
MAAVQIVGSGHRDSWGMLPYRDRQAHRIGRTCPGLITWGDEVEIEMLYKQYLSHVYTGRMWAKKGNTEKMDLISTAILKDGRRQDRDDGVVRGCCGPYDEMSVWQMSTRMRRELLMENMEWLDRGTVRLRLHEGGWVGTRPRVVQDIYPTQYLGVPRTSMERV